MIILAYLLYLLGIILAILGAIGLYIAAYKTSVAWGVGCFMIPPIMLLFVIEHWEDAKNPFFLWVIGIVICVISGGFRSTG